MSFRSDPLPSYEDVISGAFLLKKSTKSVNIDEKTTTSVQNSAISGGFKYKNIVENEVEDGEVLEDGEINDSQSKSQKVTRNNTNNSSNSKKVKNSNTKTKNSKNNNHSNVASKGVRVQKSQAEGKKSSADFTSNITVAGKTPFVPRLVCRYFMEGICSKGDKCTFSHAAVPNKTPEEARVKEPCKFFIAGSCMKGDTCYFSHDLSVVPCKFFHLRGECSAAAKGNKCRFSHEPIDAVALEKLRIAEKERVKEAKELENQQVNNNGDNSPFVISSAKPPERFETHEEAKTSAESPHYFNPDQLLLNPFAGGDDNDDDYVDY